MKIKHLERILHCKLEYVDYRLLHFGMVIFILAVFYVGGLLYK